MIELIDAKTKEHKDTLEVRTINDGALENDFTAA